MVKILFDMVCVSGGFWQIRSRILLSTNYHMYNRPEGIMLQNSSLSYSKFPKKSLHYAHYYSFYAPHCCHHSLFCSNLLKQYKRQCYSYACSANTIILQHQ